MQPAAAGKGVIPADFNVHQIERTVIRPDRTAEIAGHVAGERGVARAH
ncbi:MAG: hypothetical protein ACI9ZM_002478 [Paracoccaceae bacterium]|jgi:hypothetical protein